MSVSKICAALGVTAVVTSGLALGAIAPANADPSFTPGANDYVAVGSDTSQFAMDFVADGATVNGTPVPGYNQQNPAPANKLATFDACTYATGTLYPCTPGGTITLRSGTAAIARPNGSGAGKGLLYGTGDDTDVTFARSSSSLNPAEASAGLYQYPYALDTLQMAVSHHTASDAPAALTPSQILGIYTGTITNWSQVGGTAGTIKPLIPQTGSGTRSFFLAQLQALNGGVAPSLAGTVTEVQEHDPTPIQDDPTAVAPFSVGRAKLAGSVLQLESGYSAKRAIYNVVRSTSSTARLNVGSDYLEAFLGTGGFLCSPAAKSLIAAGGLQQLATPSTNNNGGGVCGVPTQAASTNFLLAGQKATTTSLVATSTGPNAVSLDATVTAADGAPAPTGTVDYYEGTTKLGTATLSAGKASLPLSLVTPGTHSYRADFIPTDDTTVEPTSGSVTANVKSSSTTAVSFSPTTTSYGRTRTAHVTVTGSGGTATGTVSVTVGSYVGHGTLSNGTADVTIPATTSAGAKIVQVAYAGSDAFTASSVTAGLTVRKAASVTTETFPAATKAGARSRGSVKVAITPSSSVKPTGVVTVKFGARVLARHTLTRGVYTVTLPKLPKGKHTLTITYGGSANVSASSRKFTLTQR